ncbi:MAG: hypothetical protein WA821_16805, partial [Anaerolineales bacterium]
MNPAIANLTYKFSISFVIVALLFQSMSPAVGAAAQAAATNPADGPALSSIEGMTLGSEIAPDERASDSPVPDFGEQVAAQANARPAEAVPLRLKAFAVPAIYIPGKPLQIQWAINGLATPSADAGQPGAAGSGPQLSIQSPAGLTPSDPALKAAMSDQGLLNVPDGNLAGGQAAWTVGASAKFPLNFTLTLTQAGQIVDQENVLVDIGRFDIAASGGSINANDGWVKINVPAGAVTQALTFDVRSPSPQEMPPVSLTGYPVEIVAVGKADGQDIKHFSQPISIQMQYDPDKLPYPNSQDSLTLYYYNPQLFDWFPLPTMVDTVNHTLTAQSDHLTVFDYKANNWQTDSLPTVDSFKVSDFTGAASYNLSMWTPPGPGGLQPSISLNYNSQVIDESSAYSQASWVGMGWALDTGSITRNMHDTDDDPTDDTFSISVGGISGTLLPVGQSGSVTTFKTADDSFAKIQFDDTKDSGGNTTSTWTVWGKDGKKYVFDTRLNTNKTESCAKQYQIDQPLNGGITWQWELTSVTDTTNADQTPMSYTYTFEQKPGSVQVGGKTYNCQNIIAAYPDTITYPNGKYRVRFELEERKDYREAWEDPNSRSLFGKQRLKTIWVERSPSGGWGSDTVALRRYDLTYAPDSPSNGGIYPNFAWDAKTLARTLTLLGVQEKSGNATSCSVIGSCLPPVTFIYQDGNTDNNNFNNLHVKVIDNGQGGKVQMEYQRWYYYDDLNDDLRSLLNAFGKDECNLYKKSTNWTSWTGSSVVCSGVSPSTLNVTGVAQHDVPENVSKPGGRFRYGIDLSVAADTTVTYGFIDTGANKSVIHTDSNLAAGGHTLQADFEMPADYNPLNTKLQLSCSSQCQITMIQFQLMPSFWRVTKRMIKDAVTGRSAAFTYHYDNAAPNTQQTSAVIAKLTDQTHVDWNTALYTPRLREFRGHAMTQVVDPNNLANVTWYYQSDALKGRAYHTLTEKQSFYDGFEDSATIDTDQWTPSTGTTLKVPNSFNIPYAEDDGTVYSTTSATTWAESLTRKAPLGNGQVAVAHFRLSGASAQGEVGLVSSAGQFFGLFVQSKNEKQMVYLQNAKGNMLISADPDKWCVVELFVDRSNGFRLRVWQEDNPATSAEITLPMPADTWTFRERVNSAVPGSVSTLSIDAYFEGTPYAESETSYITDITTPAAARTGTEYDTI